ncbi:hypothetical protein FIBSPDRAFT_855700 [Athelia psychrophila]|uniref:CID domain-containing protein n=1 Tax=Athelia psychrophila TaxID=1759441 RepID=A0A166NYT8_9AGAM|nr:hypothetical protein FIBSPDRAFT_855700 [Fibularhizoctonia sp. CBS 109695]
MTSLAAFEKTLKEVVGAKRVSASKMTSLTESALKSMDNDTQLVSILYRTHKSLPTPGKVSSLYAFDALARAARSKVTKYNLTGDVNSEKGNCATFLLKIEGVLDGLFQDMVVTGTPETREKAKKILDIWTKSSTFSPKVLMRLKDVVKDAEQENGKAVTTPPVGDPRTANQVSTPTPPIVTPQAPAPTATPVDPTQSTLLALLHQAANGGLNTCVEQPLKYILSLLMPPIQPNSVKRWCIPP